LTSVVVRNGPVAETGGSGDGAAHVAEFETAEVGAGHGEVLGRGWAVDRGVGRAAVAGMGTGVGELVTGDGAVGWTGDTDSTGAAAGVAIPRGESRPGGVAARV